ncbi:pilus assembly protein [Prochlorococcus marinus str. MU1402]|uniref:acetyltransferase n=1 Tax=Prochlorococcus marinus TaxID=1219 RepID=UPI001ADC14C4|nr:acetyltransferase [Prochlorococcus marinus]MBO8232401.1 acetyltransferase [Prochlorococcus marinus XMU1402]MBW3057129.1 pilus assembly protein [Prochlorococcus marinus str. MU1402]
MKKIIIIGAGGHSNVIEDTLIELEIFNEIAYLDDNFNNNTKTFFSKTKNILGTTDQIFDKQFRSNFKYAFVAIGDSERRLKLIDQLENLKYEIPIIIHPTAWVSKSASLGIGSIVLSQSTIQTGVKGGKGLIINNSCSIDHDSFLGHGVHIAPGVNIAGSVHIGDRSWIGIGASVIENITIGSDVKIGANAAVISNIPNSVNAIGVPAKIKN